MEVLAIENSLLILSDVIVIFNCGLCQPPLWGFQFNQKTYLLIRSEGSFIVKGISKLTVTVIKMGNGHAEIESVSVLKQWIIKE